MRMKIRRWALLGSACLLGCLFFSCDLLGLGFPSEMQGTWWDSYKVQYYRFDATHMYYHSDYYDNGEYKYDIVEFDKAGQRFKEKSSSGKVNAWYYKVQGDTLSLYSCNGSTYTGAPTIWSAWSK